MNQRYPQLVAEPPIYGMNTVDDIQELKPGECPLLVNAQPGRVLKPVNGSSGVLLTSSSTWTVFPPPTWFRDSSGDVFVFFWVYDSDDSYYHLKKIAIDTSGASTDLGEADFVNEPFFRFINLHNSLYVMISEPMSEWEGETDALAHKIVESDGTTIRDMCITVSPTVTVDTEGVEDAANGVLEDGDCYSWAFTYIRRVDASAFEAGTPHADMILPAGLTSKIAKEISTFMPGACEGVESVSGRTSFEVGVTTNNEWVNILLDIPDGFEGDTIHQEALRQGATHIRIFRTRALASVALADAATHYYHSDYPLGLNNELSFVYTAINTSTDQITITGHGLSDGQGVKFFSGDSPGGLTHNTTYYAIVVDANTIQLASTAALAMASTQIDITTQGTGTHYLYACYMDTTSDDTLSGETNQLVMDQYNTAPEGEFVEYHRNRFWIMVSSGKAYYSEQPGGDGGIDTDLAILYPQRYSAMWKEYLYFMDNDSEDGQKGMGIARLGDDLYFFKENKIFALYGGDPTANDAVLVSGNIGCAFKHTITKTEIKGLFRDCILFMSNRGPYVLMEGGELRPFTEFKIAELWPEHSDELYGDLSDHWDHIQNNCSATFHQNNWKIIYKNYAGTFKTFSYYFSPELINDPGAPKGAWQHEFATV